MSRRRRLIRGGGLGNVLGVGQGLQAWYDFSQSSYLTLSSAAITQALDRSGNGNHTAVQATGTARPTFDATGLNGKGVATFDGGDFLTLPSALYTIPSGDNTLFIVSKRTSEDGTFDSPLCMGENGVNNGYVMLYSNVAGSCLFRNRQVGGSLATTTGDTNTDFQILRGRREGTTQGMSVNGGTEATLTTATDPTTVDIGYIGATAVSSLFLTGEIAEILIYNRSLTTAEISLVNTYLNNKWAL